MCDCFYRVFASLQQKSSRGRPGRDSDLWGQMDALSLLTAGERHASSANPHPWAAVSLQWRQGIPREGTKVPHLLFFPVKEKFSHNLFLFVFFSCSRHPFRDRISCGCVTWTTFTKISTSSTSPNEPFTQSVQWTSQCVAAARPSELSLSYQPLHFSFLFIYFFASDISQLSRQQLTVHLSEFTAVSVGTLKPSFELNDREVSILALNEPIRRLLESLIMETARSEKQAIEWKRACSRGFGAKRSVLARALTRDPVAKD